MFNPVRTILKKRSGEALSPAEISEFIGLFLADKIPDYQMSALLMAIYFQGIGDEEITGFTKAYISSGSSLSFPPDILTADKHSTGGVGDKISLMLAPIAAALGLYVPMISGRGLGHTGGTLDKLESIPGFNTQYSMPEFHALVLKNGFALVGQSENLVPADKRIYALRDVTATVESPGLITASIMSKKIAEGARHLVIDLKVGSGAFMPNLRRAEELAEHLTNTGKAFGQKVSVVFSNMNSPLGNSVGNALEVIEAIEYLKGNPLPDTELLTTALVSQMLFSSGLASSDAQAREMIQSVIQSGKALEAFRSMLIAQEGDPGVIDDYTRFGKAKYCIAILSDQSGYIHKIDSTAIGYALVHIHAGRMKVSDEIDYIAGATLPKKIGDYIEKEEILGLIHCNKESEGLAIVDQIRSAYKIAELSAPKEDLILKINKYQT